jgi:hypothetical protein
MELTTTSQFIILLTSILIILFVTKVWKRILPVNRSKSNYVESPLLDKDDYID